MAAELTNTQIMDVACEHLTGFAWDEDKVEAFARAILALATQQATQGAEPDGWLYVMHMEGGQKNKAFSDDRYDFPTHSPFGRRGRDYSEEYEVTEHPIHLTAPPPTAEVERDAIPEGCTPADARVLREANHLLAETEQRLRRALRFYAAKYHFGLSDPDAWDTVSGEPTNFWCDEAGTATVEDGWVAQAALRGEADDWGEDGPPPLCPGEPEHIMLAALQSDQAQAGKGDGNGK